MPIDPVKIPQNVQIEDHVIGPLSLRQLAIIMIGSGFSYVLYSGIQKTYGAVTIPLTIIAWIPAFVATMFAIVKVNDLSLLRICLLLAERTQKPSIRMWTPRRGITINIKAGLGILEKRSNHIDVHEQSQQKIAELSSVVDSTLPLVALPDEDDELMNSTPMPTQTATPTQAAPSMDTIQPQRAAPTQSPTATATLTPTAPQTPRAPVDPSRIATDATAEPNTPPNPSLSDLSIFRDIFPLQ